LGGKEDGRVSGRLRGGRGGARARPDAHRPPGPAIGGSTGLARR
jgi:hypothetical protein